LVPTFWRARLDLVEALLAQGNSGEAVDECREILKRAPDATEAIILQATALAAQGKIEEAIPHWTRALELEPGNARAHFCLGQALTDLGRPQSAIAHLSEAIRLRPDNVQMLWQTAWILATSPSRSIRNGAQGVELANRAIQLSEGKEVRAFDALAAALAETEKFSAAVDAADRASAIALARNDDALADAIEQRIRLYRQGLPYRQPAASPPGKPAPPAAPQ
jgi:tetratricopeptide (TPR) repeat protein